jgi:outer membrane lipoprotein
MYHQRFGPLLPGLWLLTTLSCASADDLGGPPVPQLSFIQVKADPDSYKGQPITLSGEVLSARRLKDGTRIEVLQLPLTSQQPILDRTQSQGRFLAMQRDFLDPATIPPGTLVTVTGELAGSIQMALDETDYTYPMVEIQHLQVWSPREEQIRPYWGPGPYGSPLWSPYRRPWPYW